MESLYEKLNRLDDSLVESKNSWLAIQTEIATEWGEGRNPFYDESSAGDYVLKLMGKVEAELDISVVPSVQGGYGDVYIHLGDSYVNSGYPVGPFNFTDFSNEIIDLILEADTEDEFIEDYKDDILAYLDTNNSLVESKRLVKKKKLTEGAAQDINIEKKLDFAASKNKTIVVNINRKPGDTTINTIKGWADKNNKKLAYVDKHTDLSNFEDAITNYINRGVKVLIIDEYSKLSKQSQSFVNDLRTSDKNIIIVLLEVQRLDRHGIGLEHDKRERDNKKSNNIDEKLTEGMWAYQTYVQKQPGEKQPSKSLTYGNHFIMSRSPYRKERFGADWERHINKIIDWCQENNQGLIRSTHDFRLDNFGKNLNSPEAFIAAIEHGIETGEYELALTEAVKDADRREEFLKSCFTKWEILDLAEAHDDFTGRTYEEAFDYVLNNWDNYYFEDELEDKIEEMLTEDISKGSLIRWLKDNAAQDISTDEFNTLVNNLWNVIEKENAERKFYKRGYKSIEEVDVPQLIDSSDNPVHNIGYRLLGWSAYDDDIDEMLTENRWNPYFTPYGYRDAVKVINGKAPEYYYHLKEIEMDRGEGVKLARYAMRKGLPVMVDKDSDPYYPEFAIKGKYHWNDYFYPYPTAHEEDLVAWDGKMFTEQSLREENNKTGYSYKNYTICYGYKNTDRWYVKDGNNNYIGALSGFATEEEAKEYIDNVINN